MANGAGDVVLLDAEAPLQDGCKVHLECVSSLRAACKLRTAPVWKCQSQLTTKELDKHAEFGVNYSI